MSLPCRTDQRQPNDFQYLGGGAETVVHASVPFTRSLCQILNEKNVNGKQELTSKLPASFCQLFSLIIRRFLLELEAAH